MDSNPTIKWCPYPECGMAVRNPRLFYAQDSNNLLNDSDQMKNASLTTSLSSSSNKDYSRSVDCGNGHYFCWFDKILLKLKRKKYFFLIVNIFY